jgi:hypothetical protein
MKIPEPQNRLLTEKFKSQFIVARKKSSVFSTELRNFENLLIALPFDKAYELSEYSINFFKLSKVKTIFPPGTNHIHAVEGLVLEIERYLDTQRSVSIIKKVAAWTKLCEIVKSKALKS